MGTYGNIIMFKTRALGSFKSIFPNIHQPLPLDKRDSQRLLKALTTTFRAHLDKEHGWAYDQTPISTTAGPKLSYLPLSTHSDLSAPSAPSLSRDPHRRPTDRHLRSILDNPLFSYHGASMAGKKKRDPGDVFEEAVAKGLMNIKRAHGFLLSVRQGVRDSTSFSMREGMRRTGAGLLVVQWLRASGQERELGFVRKNNFTELLLKFMASEDLDGLAWIWLDRLKEREMPAGGTSEAALLLDCIVRSKSQVVQLDDAYEAMMQGEDILQRASSPARDLLLAWSSLAWQTTVDAWRHNNPNVSLFDRFVAMHEQFAKPLLLERAHLDLHHPTRASNTRAVHYLLDNDTWQISLPNPADFANAKRPGLPATLKKLMSMGLDTVCSLAKNGRDEEAEKVLGLVRNTLVPRMDFLSAKVSCTI